MNENGADGIRTRDPLTASQVLSQLGYGPIYNTRLYYTFRWICQYAAEGLGIREDGRC